MKKFWLIMVLGFISSQSPAQNWTQLQVPNTRNLYGCWFDTNRPDTGIAVGWYLQTTDRLPFAFYTKNAGATITAGSLFQIYFYASSDVWFTNFYNGIVVGNGIIQTTDGGDSWNLIVDAASTQAGILENVMFVNSTDGYAVGQRYDFNYTSMEGMIYKTSNAGGSWLDYTVSREVNNQNTLLHSVFSTGNGIIYAGADNTIGSGSTLFKSTDNAITWTPLSFSQTIWSLYFTSADTGFAATSNGLVKTTDGGNSWNNVLTSASALHTIQLKNEFGIAAGENGIIYMTADSGNSWTSVPSPVTTTLSDISILSSNLAYAVGASGTFLKYTNSTSTPELPKLVDFNCWLSNTSSLNIVWNNSNDQATLIELLNPNGTIVYTYNSIAGVSGKQHIQTNVTNLPNGIYIIRVTQNLSTAIKKFVLIK